MTYRYTIILEREADGGFHAFCPALKGCHSQGDSLDEAVANIRESIEAYLAEYSGADGGKPAHYMARRVNARGEKGPWSETLTVTISA